MLYQLSYTRKIRSGNIDPGIPGVNPKETKVFDLSSLFSYLSSTSSSGH